MMPGLAGRVAAVLHVGVVQLLDETRRVKRVAGLFFLAKLSQAKRSRV
jgi:hypothetical protein